MLILKVGFKRKGKKGKRTFFTFLPLPKIHYKGKKDIRFTILKIKNDFKKYGKEKTKGITKIFRLAFLNLIMYNNYFFIKS